MEKLNISLNPELVERIDQIVEILDLDSREELIRCATLRYVDKYFITPKITAYTS